MRRVVVVGAGIAGLALALELRRFGCFVTVVERRYPGAGNSTRNVGRLRRMQLTSDLTAFSCRASDKWRTVHELTQGRNPLLYRTRYVWVLYDDAERDALEPLQAMWDEHGAQARLVDARDVVRAVPVLSGGEQPAGGVIGAAAIVHHDAAVYAYYQAARDAGVSFHFGTDAADLRLDGDRVSAILLDDRTTIVADAVVNACGGHSHELAARFGVETPNVPIRREVLVTEPSQPFMTPAVTFYRPQEGWFNQTLRGELVAGVVDPDEVPGMNERSSLRFLGRTARVLLEKAPRLAQLRVVRQWAGVYDTTPDKRPLVGEHPERPGFYALNGWSGRGMLLAPLAAELLARELAGQGRDPALEPFAPGRFAGGSPATAVSGDYYSGYAH
ncbi:MAG TPA: FAD-binding oxidoreductase [Gaiellaceae bacterium]|nr:FAD-binding oxidoreductase [Gaiellaceae bacterium]